MFGEMSLSKLKTGGITNEKLVDFSFHIRKQKVELVSMLGKLKTL